MIHGQRSFTSSVRPFIRSPVHSQTFHSFTHSLVHPFTLSPMHSCTGSQFHPFTCSPIHTFTRSLIHTFSRSHIHQFRPSPIQTFTHSPIRLFLFSLRYKSSFSGIVPAVLAHVSLFLRNWTKSSKALLTRRISIHGSLASSPSSSEFGNIVVFSSTFTF
jgi:hypothetical protein